MSKLQVMVNSEYLARNGDADEDVELDDALFLSTPFDERIC